MFDAVYVTTFVSSKSGLLQFICVLYLYLKMGKGWYWRVIMMSASALIFGKVTYALLTSLVKVDTKIDPNFVAPPEIYALAIVSEIGWILYPFAVIIINFFKIKVLLSHSAYVYYLKFALLVAFLGYVGTRLYVGCTRYIESSLSSATISKAHGPSYAWFVACEVICCGLIFYFCYKKSRESKQAVYKTLVEGNLFSILVINTIMIILSVTSFMTDIAIVKSFNRPIEQIKSFIPLYLAIDAVSFKYKMELRNLKNKYKTTTSSINCLNNLCRHNSTTTECLQKNYQL